MKPILILVIFILCSYSLSAQCPDYQSELQNVESYISTAIMNLKKAEKLDTLVKAQQFIDKAIAQAKLAVSSANLAKEYATACGCAEGIHSANLIYHAVFDCSTQGLEAAGCGSLEELKKKVKKAITTAQSAKEQTSEGISSCLEIPEIEELKE